MATRKHSKSSNNNEQTTPDMESDTATPQRFVTGHEHSFTLQTIFELQKSVGQLTESINSMRSSVESLSSKIDKLEEKVSGVTHKLYAAGVVLAIMVAIGGFIVNKAWDLMVQQISVKSHSEIKSDSQSNKSP